MPDSLSICRRVTKLHLNKARVMTGRRVVAHTTGFGDGWSIISDGRQGVSGPFSKVTASWTLVFDGIGLKAERVTSWSRLMDLKNTTRPEMWTFNMVVFHRFSATGPRPLLKRPHS